MENNGNFKNFWFCILYNNTFLKKKIFFLEKQNDINAFEEFFPFFIQL